MQKALSLAVLLGSMVQLQGCGGGATTTAAPAATTAAPTTADPTAAPAANDMVITGSFKMKGLTKEQLENADVKKAVEKGIASTLGVEAEYVEVTGVARRLMMGRRLSDGVSVSYKLTIPKELGAAKLAEIKTSVTSKVQDIATSGTAAFVTAIQDAIAADPNISADIKTAAASIEIPVDDLTIPVDETPADTGGNSTRRLSFSFITSDEPLIL